MDRVQSDPLLDRLDAEQRRAVSMENPLLAVIAGAGSGKTTVLSRRIAYRVANDLADARHVLALTFTRQAAQELRSRLRDLGLRDDVHAGTFHAVALGVMRQRWSDVGRPVPTVVNDRRRLVQDALGQARADTEAGDITAEIDWARARLIGPDQYEAQARLHRRRGRVPTERVAAIYADVELIKRRRGIVDLDDLLGELLDAVRRDPQFGAALRWRFRHLFVDEAQDLNPLQAAVLSGLRGSRDDLTLVGDPNQAIFGFNGSDPDLLREVERRFPGIEVVRLDTNYRCSPEIVAAGGAVLPGDGDGLRSARPEGVPVEIRGYADADGEAAAVADQVRRWGTRWSSIAVLARTNAQLPALGRALAAHGIPTGGAPAELRRALTQATGQRDAARLRSWLRDVLHPDDETPPVDEPRREALTTVARAAEEFLDEEPSGNGRGFGDWVRANRPFDLRPANAVELLTFHAAKGREWRRVIVTGVESGLVPHRSATTTEARDEEARLLYVAMTRGADEVVITSAASRSGRVAKPSPLLGGLPEPAPLARPPMRLRRAAPSPDPVRQRLDEWRDAAARAAGVSPKVVCPDGVLAAIAAARPASTEALADVPGVGVLMARRFGPRILAAVSGAA